jgi:lipoyl(octanoyl) transferase
VTQDAPPRARRRVAFEKLGRVAYADGLDLMESQAKLRLEQTVPDTVYLLEHDPVFTLGRAADRSHILASEETLVREGIEVFETGRGGEVTYHGPGQLVGYPVMDLRPDRADVRRYVRDLEEVMIQVASSYGVPAVRVPQQIGIWVEGRRKLGAVGVRISRWITTHGFAFNVQGPLAAFRHIIPCGIRDKAITSLYEEAEARPSMEEVKHRTIEAFVSVFDAERIREG